MVTLLYTQDSVEGRQSNRVSVRGWLAMATGLNLAFAVCMLVCEPDWTHALSWPGRFRAAAVYIVLACLAGVFGNWIAMPRQVSGELSVLLRGALRGWVFLPSIALFIHRESVLAQVIASVAAVLMAAYMFPFTREGAAAIENDDEYLTNGAVSGIFATEVQIGASSWTPFVIAVLWGGAIAVAAAGRMMVATLCVAMAMYLLALQVANARKKVQEASLGKGRETAAREDRVYILITAAFLCVLFGLSNSAVVRSPLWDVLGRFAIPSPPAIKPKIDPLSGYHTIVLWPVEKEKKTVLRLARPSSAHAPGSAEPLVIPFYGPYWYFKFEGETPGKEARTTKGDPLKVHVRSTDTMPLLMQAHQRLAEPIETASFGQMQVVITNGGEEGAFGVGLTLTDTTSKKKASLNLGIKADSNHAVGETEETFTFAVPKKSGLEKFDAITVTFLPDAKHATSGRKVAVERFVILPR